MQFQSDAAHTRWGALDSCGFISMLSGIPPTPCRTPPVGRFAARSLVHEQGRLGRLQVDGVTQSRPVAPGSVGFTSAVEPSRAIARLGAPAGPGFATDVELTAQEVHSRWVAVSNLVLAVHTWNPRPMETCGSGLEAEGGGCCFGAGETSSDRGAGSARCLRKDMPVVAGFWTNLAPWRLQTRVTATDVHVTPRHSADRTRRDCGLVAGDSSVGGSTLGCLQARSRQRLRPPQTGMWGFGSGEARSRCF